MGHAMFGGIFGREPAPQVSAEVAAALVRADETLRRGLQEHGYATAQFGDVATRDFGQALTTAQAHLTEAFGWNALLLDDQPDSDADRDRMEAAIMAAANAIEQLVREPSAQFAAQRAALVQTPAAVEQTRVDIADLQSRLPQAQASLNALQQRYSPATLTAVADNIEQAQALLEFADRSAALALRRHDSDRGAEASKAVQVAADSVRRASDLIDSVTDFEVEVVRAESTLAAVLADSRSDIADARRLLAATDDPQILAATDALEQQVAAAAASDDPFTTLSAVRAANEALEAQVTHQRTKPERERLRATLEAALADAERQEARAAALIAAHPARIGPGARTRLAQGQRLLDSVTDVHEPVAAIEQARTSANLCAEAAALAENDLASSADPYAHGRGGDSINGVLGGVLGGLLLGGVLDDFDFDFD